jgi:hypothetical protein
MRPRSRFGSGPLKLAIWPVIVVLAAGASASSLGVAGLDVPASTQPHGSVFQESSRFEVPPWCPVITVDPNGACPLPAIPVQPWSRRGTIFLCSESLCGSGFHPGDVILLLATRSEGSTFWRTAVDPSGKFRSALPAPLCRFAPIGLTAFDPHADRSNRISLGSTGCEKAIP